MRRHGKGIKLHGFQVSWSDTLHCIPLHSRLQSPLLAGRLEWGVCLGNTWSSMSCTCQKTRSGWFYLRGMG
jgi:hypothetical protein